MLSSKVLSRWIWLAVVAALAATPALAVPNHPISIAAARALPLGTEVTVEGTATTPSGAFESSFFDKGFAIQDATAGIYVSIQDSLNVSPGRVVRATGELAESFGLLILVPADSSDVQKRGFRPQIEPLWVETAGVSEATEGLLVEAVGRLTGPPEDDLPFGFKLFIDDGSVETTIFINTQTGIDPFAYSAGQLIRVVGFASQFDDHHEIDPRSPADITTPSP